MKGNGRLAKEKKRIGQTKSEKFVVCSVFE
jgi:hypothetical protein